MHDADNSAGSFDRIALQAYVPGPYFVVQYVELFVAECKLRNIRFLSKRTAAVVVVVVVVVIAVVAIAIAIAVIVVAIVVAFDVGINQVTATFRFEGFEKFLRDASR